LRSKSFSATLGGMEEGFRYRGHVITAAEVEFIRRWIAEHPGANRRQLSLQLCEAWGWRQANGALRDMVCRGLLLELERAGHLKLPPASHVHRNPSIRRGVEGVKTLTPPLLDTGPLEVPLGALRPLEFQPVRRTADEPLFNYLVAQYHPLGYTRPVGEHLKYLVYAGGRPIACLAWSSAPRHLGVRDRFIGWSAETRRRNLRFLAYNPRYLILPWVHVPHLASHVLGQMARRIAADWERVYGHPVYFLETFVDPEHHRGTCYRAANWVVMGRTTGRGKNDQTHRPNRSIKEVLGYPLVKDFRARLEERG
jgi:Druantia protein DruA